MSLRGEDKSRRRQLVALVAGLVFGLGLGVGGMTSPRKVLDFLDLFGSWDPSLALVMAGAIAVYAPIYRRVRGRAAPRLAERFHMPTSKDVDPRLVIGSVMFGVGWGIAGACPGPALVMSVEGSLPALVFVAAMVAGMLGHSRLIAHIERKNTGT